MVIRQLFLAASMSMVTACSIQTTAPSTANEPAPNPAPSSGEKSAPPASASDAGAPGTPPIGTSSKRGFPVAGPWVSFYGTLTDAQATKIANAFRIVNLDADPKAANVTDAQIATLKAGGQNRVISYINMGACETYRSYFAECQATGALTTVYSAEYPDERWANLSNVAYRKLMVENVAQRLWDRKVDGFFLDNMEVVEHGATAKSGPCDATCAQGGLDLIWELRQRFPDALIVMQNATSEITREGKTHGVSLPSLLDGVSHEEVYSGSSAGAVEQMLAWKKLGLVVNGRPFWLAAEDYVGSCSSAAKADATAIQTKAKADGLSSYVTDASGAQTAPCFWDEL
jgi:cysteinyl-tRNA synthetase, unknown class